MIVNTRQLNLTTQLNNMLTTLSLTLQNCSLLIYKLCPQNTYKNPIWDSQVINYDYVPPTMIYCSTLNQSQISYIIEYYTNLTNEFFTFVEQNGLGNQVIGTINTIGISVSNLNSFADNVFAGSSGTAIKYKVPYDMTLSTALWLNNINQANSEITILYNLGLVSSFLLLKAGTVITLIK